MKIIIVILVLLPTAIWAQDTQPIDAADYTELAKNRSYVGGAEESDLKLLPESHFQKNKKNISEEVNEGF